jgi:hypothetical protein
MRHKAKRPDPKQSSAVEATVSVAGVAGAVGAAGVDRETPRDWLECDFVVN